MNLAAIAMRYRPVVLTLVGMLTVWGAITFVTMPRREDPEFTIRTCVVATQWPGASTIKVEELVTDKLEEALDGIEEVEKIRSTTINGLSTIYVDVEDRVSPENIQEVWNKVRSKVELVPMPNKDVKPIVNDDFGDTSVLVLGVFQTENQADSRYSPRQLELFADQVRDVIRLLPGVASVDKYGVQEEVIYIETDLGNWSQISLTSDMLRQLVESRNVVSPGGNIDSDVGKFSVKPGGDFNAVAEIESLAVDAVRTVDGSNSVQLHDLGLNVRRGYRNPPTVISRFTEGFSSPLPLEKNSGPDSPRTFPAVMIGVTMKSGSNIIDVCDSCTARIDQLIGEEHGLPESIRVLPVSNQSDNVSRKIGDVIENVVAAIIIVVIVVLLFVGVRTSLVMAANIPIVVLGSVAIIAGFGVQIEQISLASIIIALGLLVDNAVQICDQTRTNILSGMEPREAAVEGANTLALPMLSGTLTTVAAFLPMLFCLQGGGKEYVYSLPVTLSTTLLLSWFLAMTVCVIFASMFIRAPKHPGVPNAPIPWLGYIGGKVWDSLKQKLARNKSSQPASKSPSKPIIKAQSVGTPASAGENLFLRVYGLAARLALKVKWITVAAAVALLVVCMQLPVSTEFFPQDRRDQFLINVVLPETATIRQTDEIVKQVEHMIRELSPAQLGEPTQRLRAMRSMIGEGGARWALGVDPLSPASNVAEILVRTTDGEFTPGLIRDIRRVSAEGDTERGLAPITGARIVPKKLSLGPPAAPLELRVSGDGFADIDQLRGVAIKVKDLVRAQKETWDVSDSWGVEGFEITLDIDQDKASMAGVTNENVADTLNSYFTGLELSTFREGDHQIPVLFRLKFPDQESESGVAENDNHSDAKELRRKLSEIDAAFVEGQNGKVPLNLIATIKPNWEPAKIERRNSNRTIEISSEVVDGASGNDIVNEIMRSDRMKKIESDLPLGYRIEVGGSLEESQSSSKNMQTSFGVSFLIIVIVLVIQYNGWSKMIVILATLPLAMGGAWFGLWLTDNPLGFMPQLGLLSLFGIVLNTGIIFIEFADILIERKSTERLGGTGPICGLTKQEFRECLVSAGKQRMLPIFLTTATTIGGLLPLALSGGPLWEGMAWLMIFGLLVATLLTLFVVPALYAIIVESFRIRPISTNLE